MLSFTLSLLLLALAAEDAPSPGVSLGIIQGTVIDGTNSGNLLPRVEVILRASVGGEMVPVGQTRTDRYGRFAFDDVPLDPSVLYLPGANRDGVHYPGERVQLDSERRIAEVELVTYSAVDAPCPLVAERHEFDLSVEGQTLVVSESLSLSNPSQTTFVGQPMGGGVPVTFSLSIPPDFDRVTFDKELYGRRFQIVDHQPVTDMPWLPGKQEVRFTYRIPLVESEGRFLRPLDVPTATVRVRVTGTLADQITCNLPLTSRTGPLEYASANGSLPEHFALELQFTKLPTSWIRNARWFALGLLLALVAATILVYRQRFHKPAPPQSTERDSSSRQAA
jgi:hypothetical protein